MPQSKEREIEFHILLKLTEDLRARCLRVPSATSQAFHDLMTNPDFISRPLRKVKLLEILGRLNRTRTPQDLEVILPTLHDPDSAVRMAGLTALISKTSSLWPADLFRSVEKIGTDAEDPAERTLAKTALEFQNSSVLPISDLEQWLTSLPWPLRFTILEMRSESQAGFKDLIDREASRFVSDLRTKVQNKLPFNPSDIESLNVFCLFNFTNCSNDSDTAKMLFPLLLEAGIQDSNPALLTFLALHSYGFSGADVTRILKSYESRALPQANDAVLIPILKILGALPATDWKDLGPFITRLHRHFGDKTVPPELVLLEFLLTQLDGEEAEGQFLNWILGQSRPEIRSVAVTIHVQTGLEEPAWFLDLLLNDPDLDIRTQAIEIFMGIDSQIQDEATYVKILKDNLTHADPQFRLLALTSVLPFGSVAIQKRFLPILKAQQVLPQPQDNRVALDSAVRAIESNLPISPKARQVPHPEPRALVCEIVRQSAEWMQSSELDALWGGSSQSAEFGFSALQLLFLYKAIPHCEALQRPLAEIWLQEIQDAPPGPVELPTGPDRRPIQAWWKLIPRFLKSRSDRQYRDWNGTAVYGKQFSAQLLEAMIADLARLGTPKHELFPLRSLHAELVQSLADDVSHSEEKGYVEGNGGSIFNTFAVGSAITALPFSEQRSILYLREIVKKAGDPLRLGYYPGESDGETLRGSAGRALPVLVNLSVKTRGELRSQNMKNLVRALLNYKRYARSYAMEVPRKGVHLGRSGVAPYYFHPSAMYAAAAGHWLLMDPVFKNSEEGQAVQNAMNGVLSTLLSLWDSSTGSFSVIGGRDFLLTEYESSRAFSLPMMGLALLPYVQSERGHPAEEGLGILPASLIN